MAKEDGGPAFPANPSKYRIDDFGIAHPVGNPGMSLRDWFAGQALTGLIATRFTTESAIEIAYEIADAMLKQRKKQGE